MKNEILHTIFIQPQSALVGFLLYFAVTLIILFVFLFIYGKLSPFSEKQSLINDRVEPTVSFLGVMFGFLIPLLSASLYSVSLVDFAYWAGIAGAVQLVVFYFVYKILHTQFSENNMSVALMHAGLAIAIGLINAFSLVG